MCVCVCVCERERERERERRGERERERERESPSSWTGIHRHTTVSQCGDTQAYTTTPSKFTNTLFKKINIEVLSATLTSITIQFIP